MTRRRPFLAHARALFPADDARWPSTTVLQRDGLLVLRVTAWRPRWPVRWTVQPARRAVEPGVFIFVTVYPWTFIVCRAWKSAGVGTRTRIFSPKRH